MYLSYNFHSIVVFFLLIQTIRLKIKEPIDNMRREIDGNSHTNDLFIE